MRRLAHLLISLFLLTGCASGAENSNGAFSSQDIMFAEMMIPHHEQAIEMSELAFANTTNLDRLFLEGMIKHHEGAIDMAEMIIDSANQEVAKLGSSIIASQEAEIQAMKALLGK